MPHALSRREFLGRFFPNRDEAKAEAPVEENGPRAAIIQGRHCLAYQNSFCSTCKERCPEPGAIVSERGIPRVIPDLCTGCGICHELCPAPTNAILMTRAPVKATKPEHLPAPTSSINSR